MKLITELADSFEIITEAKDDGQKSLFVEGIFMQAEVKNRNGRIYPKSILEREVERYRKSHITEKRALGELGHPCFWSNTKALTENGWKYIKDVNVGEMVYSMNPTNGRLEIKPVISVNINHYKGKMLRFKNRTFDTVITPYHKFIVQTRTKLQFMTAQEIKDQFIGTQVRTYKIPKTHSLPIDRNNTTITIPGISDHRIAKFREDLVLDLYYFSGFLGFWLAEGHTSTRGKYGSTGFCQKKLENVAEITTFVEKLPQLNINFSINKRGVHTWECRDPRLYKFLSVIGKSWEKFIPKQILNIINEEQAGYLLDMFVLGDGTYQTFNNKKSSGRLFSTSRKLLEDMTIVSLLANRPFRLWDKYPSDQTKDRVIEGYTIDKNNLRDIHAVTLLNSSGVYLDHNHMSIEEIDYDDNVYCLTVADNSTFYVMDGGYGFWTGNCGPKINEDRVSHLITELNQNGNDFIGKAKILSTPMGNIARSLIEDGVKIGVSSRGLGSLKEKNGVNEVQDDFFLATVDIVTDPSAPSAFVNGIMEGVEFWYNPSMGAWVAKELEQFAKSVEETKKEIKKMSSKEILESKARLFEQYLKNLSNIQNS